MTQASQGTFTQVPNVFIDTCDLPDSSQILFMRLLRHYGHKGGIYTGSIRKLAADLNMNKDKVCRDLHTLHNAALAILETSNNTITITLSINELWLLNSLLTSAIEIPRWQNLADVLESVSNLIQPKNDDESVSNLRQSVSNLIQQIKQRVSNLRQSVSNLIQPKEAVRLPDRLAKRRSGKPRNTNNTITYNNTEKNISGATAPATTTTPASQGVSSSKGRSPKQQSLLSDKPPAIFLTEEENRIYGYWQTLHNSFKVPITETVKRRCNELAPFIHSQDDMKRLYDFSRSQPLLKGKGVQLGNLVQYYTAWLSTLPSKPAASSQSAEPETVIWTRQPEIARQPNVDPYTHWKLYERMPLETARQYGYDTDYPSLTASQANDIENMIDLTTAVA